MVVWNEGLNEDLLFNCLFHFVEVFFLVVVVEIIKNLSFEFFL